MVNALILLLFSGLVFAQKLSKEACGDIDIREMNPIKSNPRLTEHFKTPRNQDSAGWCYAFTASDIISVEAGVPVSATHTSSIYNNYLLTNPDDRKFSEKYREKAKGDAAFQGIFESGFTDRAIRETVNNGWICTEKGFPFDKNKRDDTKKLLEELENLKSKASNKSQEVLCDEIKGLSKDIFLLKDELKKISESLLKKNINETVKLYIESACTEKVVNLSTFITELYVKAPGDKSDKFHTLVNNQLSRGRPVGVAYVLDNLSIHTGNHGSVIMARRWRNGSCEYNLRNSWGESCESYTGYAKETCNLKEGTFWVKDNVLFNDFNNISFAN